MDSMTDMRKAILAIFDKDNFAMEALLGLTKNLHDQWVDLSRQERAKQLEHIAATCHKVRGLVLFEKEG